MSKELLMKTINKSYLPNDLDSPELFLNRELSWLQFNRRVLDMAVCEDYPLLERVKYLAIYANNLDEFFMIRVSGLRKQIAAGSVPPPADGMTPSEQLKAIHAEINALSKKQTECWQHLLLPKLNEAGIRVYHYQALSKRQQSSLRRYFEKEIYPSLTPLAFDPGHPFPHISNLSINLAVVINYPKHGERFARIKIPDIFPRLLQIRRDINRPLREISASDGMSLDFVWIEEVIAANLDILFPGLEIVAAYPFRIIRDADLEIEEDEASDLLSTIQETINMRPFGSVVKLEIDHAMPDKIRDILVTNLGIVPAQVYVMERPLGMANILELANLNRPDLKEMPFVPSVPASLSRNGNIFSAIQEQNILLYHPYDSFSPVVRFIEEAAGDPSVLAIKQTLYRVDSNSAIVNALIKARENGKQVAVLVELKARFDEGNNIAWAQSLEKAGVHVVYGLIGLKTHAKMSLIVRKEKKGIVRYVHLSTGNYNMITGRIYTDLGYFTCDPKISADVSDLFNALTGYSLKENYCKILVAPYHLRTRIIEKIERETAIHRQSGNGYIAFKLNSLVDKECIKALYRASQAGVKINLQIRSICCLKPGIPGISENITVTSIVGRFLEHTRIYYFKNGGNEEIFLGSADLMPRNLDRRVEILFPVEDPKHRLLIQGILHVHLKDNIRAQRLTVDGVYEPIRRKPAEPMLDSQIWLLENWGAWNNHTDHWPELLVAATAEVLDEKLS